MSGADLSDILAVSVGRNDRPFAERELSGARMLDGPLDAAVAKEHQDVRFLSVMVHDRPGPELLDRLARLEAVVTRSTGYDHLPTQWMQRHDVAGYALGGYSTQSVAQFTLMLILGQLHRVPEAMAVTQGAFRGGTDPPRWDRSRLMGRSLADVTVGILGTGRIGGRLVRLLSGLGVRVVGHDILPDPALAGLPAFRYAKDLADLASSVDVLSVHVPLTTATRGLIDAALLDRLPPSAVLVNTCRGEVLDQAAVEAALRSGRLAGYAADLMPGEPEPTDLGRFADLPNVVITPHLAAYNEATVGARWATAARILRALADGHASDVASFRIV